MSDALVCFGDGSGLWWLRGLRPGFRHCFVALRDEPFWVVIDPLSHHTMVRVEIDDDLAGFYRRIGLRVVETQSRTPPQRMAPWRPYTCVESVKRILGLHEPWVLTPFQLYRYLHERN